MQADPEGPAADLADRATLHRVASEHGYAVRFEPLGPVDATHGAPSQMAVFERGVA